VLGGAQVVIYLRQAGIMEEQARISGEQVKLMQADQRPWIEIQSIIAREEGAAAIEIKPTSIDFVITYKTKNVGKSPAFIEVVSQALLNRDAYEPVQEKICSESHSPHTWLVMPNGEFPYNGKAPLDTDDVKIASGMKNLQFLIVGCVFYRIFESKEIHRTPFVARTSVEPEKSVSNREFYVPFKDGKLEIPKGNRLLYKNLLMAGHAN
jgi:hypothetical protein